ncbi:hypothetical protein Taro_043935 [Colocasia esculenta]|uniref:Uncharacterized protein n=1 Tax=Colocasia esculenta TaxID=4460 RepID=A0A843WHR3_COLES|nr:hypothetical protein [Colocasia esculenta]
MVELRSGRRVENEETPSASGARVDTSRGRTLERLEAPAPPAPPPPRIRELRNPAKLVLATGMGANIYFAYNLIDFSSSGPVPYRTALAVVLVEGCVFFVMSATGRRRRLARLIPRPICLAAAVGIGLFLTFVGLVSPSPVTLVTLWACAHVTSSLACAPTARCRVPREVWTALASLLYVDILDTTGTMYSLAELGGFVDETKGSFEGECMAFLVDGGASVLGSALRSSTVTTYVESTSGIKEGTVRRSMPSPRGSYSGFL